MVSGSHVGLMDNLVPRYSSLAHVQNAKRRRTAEEKEADLLDKENLKVGGREEGVMYSRVSLTL